jgi:beta-galactosidase
MGWDVPYEPGVLKAVGSKNGRPVCEFALKTAGEAKRIELDADTTQLRADGKDICHVEFRIVDAQGVRVPNADQSLTFELDGPAEIIGIGNGDLNNTEDCKGRVHKAYQGKGLAILRSNEVSGKISLRVTAPGLETATLTLSSR